MYTITKLRDGGFLCEVRIQDGTERWHEVTLDAAIKSVKEAAPALNGPKAKIKKRNIRFFQEAIVAQVQRVPWSPSD